MKKLKRTFDNALFLLRPGLRFGKGLLLLMLVSQALPSLVNSVVTVATPKIAIDGLLGGDPVGRIILNVSLLILAQLAVGAVQSILSYGTSIKQVEFGLRFTKMIL